MKITLHIYSGRKNPTWVLSGVEMEELRTELMQSIADYQEANGSFHRVIAPKLG